MSNKIALTASMRSNLLSLKETQGLMNTTQDRLSSGYRVNSAMDNPSSYFTAQSLNSRSNDLTTLLDSIGQAISTLEVADEGITTLQEFTEQAKSIANSARDTANVASKATTENVVFNSATAKEDVLSEIVNVAADDEFTIRLGDATTMEGTANITADQKLSDVGLEKDGVFEMIVGDKKYEFTIGDVGETAAAAAPDADGVIKQTIGVDETVEDFMKEVVYTVGRKVLNAEINEGKLSFSTMDNSSLAIRSTESFHSANTVESFGYSVEGLDGLTATGETGGKLTIDGVDIAVAEGAEPKAVAEAINNNAELKAKGVTADYDSDTLVVKGSTAVPTSTASTGGAAATVAATAAPVELEASSSFNDVFGFDKGMTVKITEGMTVEEFRQSIDNLDGISADFDSKGHFVISGDEGDDMVIADLAGDAIKNLLGDDVYSATNGSNERAQYAAQFDDVLDQIDQLVQDTSYKGVNLLKGDDLTVVFNESRTSSLELEGVTFDSTGLGFTRSEAEWANTADIDASLDQITKATSMLRAQASEFGQNLSTVQIREDFTESMINNLTTGADKLTLADMNEEAANMLALQTRQQLGTNSLSMASQAAQSVLNLF